MKPVFVHTSNVKRMLAAYEQCLQRGASEASWVLVAGNAGHGKTRSGHWFADRQDAIHIRIKADVTPGWIKRELARELGYAKPPRSREALFQACFDSLAKYPRPIVLDEVENALRRDIGVLEAIRDLSDLIEMPVVLIGREWVPERLKEHRQIWSRISGMATYTRMSLDDVTLLRETICEVEVDGALDDLLLEQSGGYIRELMNGLANIERIGRRRGQVVRPADVSGVALTRDLSSAISMLEDERKSNFEDNGLRVIKGGRK
ncbi:MAG: ATP-binding protein [Geminicoccaceae bacterium]|nr:ATP-binding protein [Geminicoccaceae bacterium]